MKKKIIITAVCILIFILFCLILIIKSENRAEKLYRQGISFEQKEDYQNAYYNFSRISIFSRLYPLSLYKQAYNAQNVRDDKTAVNKYKAFLRIEKNNNILAPNAYWQLGNIYIDQKKDDQAIKIFKELKEKYPDSDYSHASDYFMGTLKNDSESKDFLIKYLEYAPGGRYSQNAIMFIENSDKELSEEDKIVISRAYYINGNYEKSLSYLRTCSFKNTWLDIAKNYEKLQDIDMAQRTYMIGLGQLQRDTKYNDEEIQSALSSYSAFGPQNKKSVWESILNITNTPGNPSYLGALFNYAQYLPLSEASGIYRKIYNEDKNSYYTPGAVAELIFYNYKIRNYNEALKFGQIAKDNYIYSKAAPKSLFWSAKSAIRLKNKSLAQEFLNLILENNPNDYYAFRAEQLLHGKENKYNSNKTKIKEKQETIDFPYFESGKNKFYIDKLVSFNDINSLTSIKFNDKFVESWLNYNKKRVTYSNILARDGMDKLQKKPDSKDPRWKLLYPVYYADSINKNAALFNVSPYLVLSIIREESHFDENAKSPAGALGLMQIMPSTAEMTGGKNYDNSKILDADYNIYLGTKYFSNIIKLYKNQEIFGVLSYNSGPNAVKKWLNNTKINDFDEFVEDIPYSETKNYFKKVYASYYNYLRIYN